MQQLESALIVEMKIQVQLQHVTRTLEGRGDFRSGLEVSGFALEEVDIFKCGNHYTSKKHTCMPSSSK